MDKKNCDGTQYPKHALKCKRTQHSECWHGIITLLCLFSYQHRLCDDRKVIIFGGNEESNQSFDCSFNAGVLMKYYTVRWFVGDVELTFFHREGWGKEENKEKMEKNRYRLMNNFQVRPTILSSSYRIGIAKKKCMMAVSIKKFSLIMVVSDWITN